MDLNEQIAKLEAQQSQIEEQLNSAQDSNESARITNELNLVRNRLSEKREELRQQQEKEQARAEEIEDRVNAEPVPFTALGIDLSGMPVEMVAFIEGIYRTTRRAALNEHAIELEQLEAEHDSAMQGKIDEYNKLSAHITELSDSNVNLTNAVDRLEHELAQAIIEKEDAIGKRDAAVVAKETAEEALRQANEEVKELYAKLEQYEKAAEYQSRQDQPINMTAEETSSLQASADAVKKLFTESRDWGSRIQVFKPDGGFELVKRAEFEEEWTPTPPELSLELPSFRTEDTASNVEDNPIPTPEAPAAVTEEPFQSDVLAGHSDTDAGEAETATIEERVARLEAAVFGQGKAAA